MLKNEHGITLTILVVTIIVILILASVGIYNSEYLVRDTKAKSIISNMYLVKGKVETIYEEYQFSANAELLIGTQVAQGEISLFPSKYGAVLDNNTKDFWYTWNKENLETVGLSPEMLSNDEVKYIVNYATGEVIYTKGIKNKYGVKQYLLSEIVKKGTE